MSVHQEGKSSHQQVQPNSVHHISRSNQTVYIIPAGPTKQCTSYQQVPPNSVHHTNRSNQTVYIIPTGPTKQCTSYKQVQPNRVHHTNRSNQTVYIIQTGPTKQCTSYKQYTVITAMREHRIKIIILLSCCCIYSTQGHTSKFYKPHVICTIVYNIY